MPHREMTIGELSAYLHVPREDLERLVRRDEIPFERKGPRVVFLQADIDAWASQRLLGFGQKHLRQFHLEGFASARDLARPHAIMTDLCRTGGIEPALTCRTRASVLREMVQLAMRTELLNHPDDLLKSIEYRERLCSTALPGGIALLHPRSPNPYLAEDSFLVLGRTVQAIPFGAPDGSTTDLFFLICCREERLHLHVLARLCMMARDTEMIGALRAAADAPAMLDILIRSEDCAIRNR